MFQPSASAGHKFTTRAALVHWNCCTEYEAAVAAAPRARQCELNPSCGRAMELASRSHLDLQSLIHRQPSPPVEILQGAWIEVRKGYLPAITGQVYAVRLFDTQGVQPAGYRVPVGVHQAESSGDAELYRLARQQSATYHPAKSFAINASTSAARPLRLDFTEQHHDWLHGSKYRIEDLVMIDSDLLLGQSHTKLGNSHTPGGFFVLYRADAAQPMPVNLR